MKRIFLVFTAIAVFFLANTPFVSGKSLPLIVESQYFSVYGSKRVDINDLLERINYNYILQMDRFFELQGDDPLSIFARTLDALYLEVSDILGINVYSYHGKINILPDARSVNAKYRDYAGVDLNERSFYFHQENTIYISDEDLTLGILGHEIAHAIISNYFVVEPPMKVQEVLSGYVEFNLRKSTGTLPSKASKK